MEVTKLICLLTELEKFVPSGTEVKFENYNPEVQNNDKVFIDDTGEHDVIIVRV